MLMLSAGYAQNERIDSLLKVLPERKGGERFQVLYALGYEYIDVDNPKAEAYAVDAFQLASSLGDSLRMVQASRIQGSALRRMERITEAIDVSLSALNIAKRNHFEDEVKILLNSIALAYTFKAEYDKALDFHFQSLVAREKKGNKPEISITLNNIGFVYFKLKNYDQAIVYFSRSLTLKREAGDRHDLDRLLINIGLSYNHLKNYEFALKYINEGLQECGVDCSDQIIIEGKFGLGVSFFGLKQYNKSEQEFKQSLEISRKTESKRWQSESLVYLAKIAIIRNETESAKKFLEEAEALASHAGYNQLLMDAYKQFSALYNQSKDFEKASFYQDRYIKLKDSLISEELVKNIAKIQTRFEERENRATIASKEVVIKQQRDLNIAIAVIALLAGLLILVLQRGNRTIKKVNAALSEAKQTIEDQNTKLHILNKDLDNEVRAKTSDLEKANHSLHRVVDELDNFIYKTSHDIRGPLASLKGICNIAMMDVKDEEALKYFNKLDVTAEKLNTILTRLLIVNQINNSAIKADDLINFEHVVNDVLLLEKKKGLPVRLDIRKSIGSNIVFYSDKEFVRIILENLIDNAIKFYNDSDRVEPFVDIRVEKLDDSVLIRVIDNGIGISEIHPDKIFQMFSRASERSETGGIGLFITKTATEKLGGIVGLKTTPEGYTEFFVKFSLLSAPVLQ
ncbi:MAG: tetratricopeptide repeat-containing sensor histidine kinase [Cyclobacteriaceae bacterium]|nr:tetratricopeptide repeat-containing sensor histidine kinase [Cyclobacteriaceae bacterium]